MLFNIEGEKKIQVTNNTNIHKIRHLDLSLNVVKRKLKYFVVSCSKYKSEM